MNDQIAIEGNLLIFPIPITIDGFSHDYLYWLAKWHLSAHAFSLVARYLLVIVISWGQVSLVDDAHSYLAGEQNIVDYHWFFQIIVDLGLG